MALHSSKMGAKAKPVNKACKGARISVFQLARRLCDCSCGNKASTSSSQVCQVARTSATNANACVTRSSSNSPDANSAASSTRPSGNLSCLKNAVKASHSLSLFCKLSSMLMRSMPSVYSAIRGKGITTSSLILNALVCLDMAAARLRSNQNLFRASGLMAMKPSPLRELAMRTTSDVTRATSSASSPAMSPIKTILGKPLLVPVWARLDLVA